MSPVDTEITPEPFSLGHLADIFCQSHCQDTDLSLESILNISTWRISTRPPTIQQSERCFKRWFRLV